MRVLSSCLIRLQPGGPQVRSTRPWLLRRHRGVPSPGTGAGERCRPGIRYDDRSRWFFSHWGLPKVRLGSQVFSVWGQIWWLVDVEIRFYTTPYIYIHNYIYISIYRVFFTIHEVGNPFLTNQWWRQRVLNTAHFKWPSDQIKPPHDVLMCLLFDCKNLSVWCLEWLLPLAVPKDRPPPFNWSCSNQCRCKFCTWLLASYVFRSHVDNPQCQSSTRWVPLVSRVGAHTCLTPINYDYARSNCQWTIMCIYIYVHISYITEL